MKEETSEKYVPVQMFVRFTKKETDPKERAHLVARREDGSEFVFTYLDIEDEMQDLIVCDFTKNAKEE
jgi:hypothetical protein